MRLVFMGTPEFAVPSLNRLVESKHDVIGVVTVPDKPAGRGLKERPSAVKQAASDLDLPVLQPEKLKDPGFLSALRDWQADCYAVVAFRILPVDVFGIPRLGTVNLHTSLLPKYRGAAPIQWALMNGDSETGVTTFLIDRRVDTGNILMQKRIAIQPDEDAGSLHDKLAEAGADLLVQTMDKLEASTIEPRPQKGEATPAPKIIRVHCRIDWSDSNEKIRDQIRALSPMPGAFTGLNGKRMKLFETDLQSGADSRHPSGSILKADDSGILVQCGTGRLLVHELQLEGKKRMRVSEFLRGNTIKTGDRFISS